MEFLSGIVDVDRIIAVYSGLATFAVIFFAMEQINPAQPNKKYLQSDNKVEIFYPLIQQLITNPLALLVTSYLTFTQLHVILPHQIFSNQIADLPYWAQVLVGLFVIDLALYIRHRFVHHFCWPYHAIHHSARHMTWITKLRLHPVDAVVMGVINTIVLYMIGFDFEAILTAQYFMTIWNYFVHTNVRLAFPSFLHYVIGSPHVHRWHHATEKEAINKNFTIMFCFIDVLFGTFYAPRDRLPESLGIFDDDRVQLKDNIFSHLIYPFQRHYVFLKDTWAQLSEKRLQKPSVRD
ncbi:MAG: sterol desaturase family protein [Pseudomonadota bacterium]